MKTINLTTIFLLIINFTFGQLDTITSEITSEFQASYTWKGACCDDYGKPLNPGDVMNQVYSVKQFKTKTPVDINIKSVKLGSQTISLDFHFQDNIDGETKILNINDTTGIKLTIAKTVENGTKKYLYKLQVYKKDKDSNCWRPLTVGMNYFDVYSQNMSLNLFAIGYLNSKDYFQIVEGWIKFDK